MTQVLKDILMNDWTHFKIFVKNCNYTYNSKKLKSMPLDLLEDPPPSCPADADNLLVEESLNALSNESSAITSLDLFDSILKSNFFKFQDLAESLCGFYILSIRNAYSNWRRADDPQDIFKITVLEQLQTWSKYINIVAHNVDKTLRRQQECVEFFTDFVEKSAILVFIDKINTVKYWNMRITWNFLLNNTKKDKIIDFENNNKKTSN
eukprot:GHVL01010403.1.p1 GENE.GHVL01010403.1~~GHVL01010403.1.p1  ORF type:complete len:208 (-),score=49.80 GHVL01010403.1:198-821(-)